jgi:membrane-bound hydrogenase subunit alpha
MGIEVPPRAEYIRTIVAELERIHSHVLWAGYAGHIMGFDTLFHYSWNERESIMDVLEALCGNRVNYGIMTIGGVRRDMTPEVEQLTEKSLERWVEIFKRYAEAFLEDPMIQGRTRNVGILKQQDAIELCILGPTMRGSGIAADVRQDQPYSAYADIPVTAITPQQIFGSYTGDVYDKIAVRLYEVKQSIEIIKKCLEAMPEGDIVVEPRVARMLPLLKKADGEGISSIEGPRGEDFHYVKLEEGNENITSWKVRAPTYSNLMAWAPMMRGSQIADVPLIVASVDPCMSCTDRVMVIDQKKGTTSILTEADLRRLSIEKTRRMMK